MNSELLLDRAVELARKAHEGQVDKAGLPYIGHPIRVMNNLANVEEKIVGVLHDVVEDSDLTLRRLFHVCWQRLLNFLRLKFINNAKTLPQQVCPRSSY